MRIPVVAARRARNESRTVRVAKEKPAVPIYSGASTEMPVVAQLSAGYGLRSDAVFSDEWRRVALPGDRKGFVRTEEVEVVKAAARKPPRSSLSLDEGHAAPSISLDLDSLRATQTMRIKGVIQDTNRLKDMFIFVNDRKVHYRSLSSIALSAGKFSLPIDVEVPMEEGSNLVAVIVRETDDLVARSVFGAYRDKSPTTVAAERSGEKPDTKIR